MIGHKVCQTSPIPRNAALCSMVNWPDHRGRVVAAVCLQGIGCVSTDAFGVSD